MNKRWQALCGLAAGTLAGIAFSLAAGLVSPLVGFALVVGGLAAGPDVSVSEFRVPSFRFWWSRSKDLGGSVTMPRCQWSR